MGTVALGLSASLAFAQASAGAGAVAAGAPVPAADVAAAQEQKPKAAKDAGDSQAPGESEADALARRSTDPTASPPSIGFINDHTLDYRDLEDGTPVDQMGYTLRFQPVVPFRAWGKSHILRVTVPYQNSGLGPEGLGDVTVFDMMVLPQSWGRLGFGAVASLVQAASDSPDHFKVGPAVVAMFPVSKKLNVGIFNQNLFGGDTAISQIQPILAYQLGGGWSLALGDLQWAYDWQRDELVSMPIGLQLGKVLPVFGQPMRFAINPQYDLKDLPGNSRFRVAFTITLLLPEGKKPAR
jgi:hypothetical protein